MNYLTKMTVKELRTLSNDMGLKPMPSSARKADIVLYVSSAIDMAHSEALEMNERVDLGAVRPVSRPMERIYRGIGTSRRVNNYKRQNNSNRLTAKQLSRASKKIRKEISYAY